MDSRDSENLCKIALYLSNLVDIQRIKEKLLEESVSLQREYLTHAYEHNTELLRIVKNNAEEKN